VRTKRGRASDRVPAGRPAAGRSLSAGVAIALVYLAGSAISGHMSPAARAPLLDGFGSLPPYRYASPPPNLQHSNQPPDHATSTLHLGPGGSTARVLSTPDLQITLVLSNGAFAAAPGETAVRVSMDPLDPRTLGPAPAGLTFVGNVYLVAARYEPSGTPLSNFSKTTDIGLEYPGSATAGVAGPAHRLLRSTDGKRWTELPTRDSRGAQQATTTIRTLGYFVVAQVGPAAPANGRKVPVLGILVGVWLVVIVALLAWTQRRARARRAAAERDSGR
jgi:hypothetical protein